MFCKGGFQLRTSALPALAMAAVILAGTSVALSSSTAGATARDRYGARNGGIECQRRLARGRQNM